MTEVFDWIRKMICLAVFLTLLLQILPEGAYRKYVKFFAGLVFVITILGPAARLFRFEQWTESFFDRVLEQEERQEEKLDLSYMEERQQQIYAKAAGETVRASVLSFVEELGFDVKEVSVQSDEASGEIARITVRVRGLSAAQTVSLREKIAKRLSLPDSRVEVKDG